MNSGAILVDMAYLKNQLQSLHQSMAFFLLSRNPYPCPPPQNESANSEHTPQPHTQTTSDPTGSVHEDGAGEDVNHHSENAEAPAPEENSQTLPDPLIPPPNQSPETDTSRGLFEDVEPSNDAGNAVRDDVNEHIEVPRPPLRTRSSAHRSRRPTQVPSPWLHGFRPTQVPSPWLPGFAPYAAHQRDDRRVPTVPQQNSHRSGHRGVPGHSRQRNYDHSGNKRSRFSANSPPSQSTREELLIDLN